MKLLEMRTQFKSITEQAIAPPAIPDSDGEGGRNSKI